MVATASGDEFFGFFTAAGGPLEAAHALLCALDADLGEGQQQAGGKGEDAAAGTKKRLREVRCSTHEHTPSTAAKAPLLWTT